MTIDIAKKRIIMIHGLASKPPQAVLDELWAQCLIENIRVDDVIKERRWMKGKFHVGFGEKVGAFISYDVLWRFSHRSEPEFEKYRRKAVQRFVTMGSG